MAAQAERLCFENPETSLIKSRQLCELLARLVAARVGLAIDSGHRTPYAEALRDLRAQSALPRNIGDLFYAPLSPVVAPDSIKCDGRHLLAVATEWPGRYTPAELP